jgi:transcriptional regulator with XRE-family HTH domain
MEGMKMRTHLRDERVGQKIRHYRQLANKSGRTLADLAGIDHGTLSRIERGLVSADNRLILARIAQALGRPITDLTGVPTPAGPDPAAATAATTRAVRAFVDADLDFTGDTAMVRPLHALEEGVRRAVQLRVDCEYVDLARMTPALIGSLHAVATTSSDSEDRKRSLSLMVRAAEAMMMAVRFTGDPGAAAMIAERAWQAAQLAGDPESLALGAWTRAHAAIGCGLNDRAHRLAERGADVLLPDAEASLPMLGMLYLTAGFAQAGTGRFGASLAPLGEAAQVAERTGETRDHGLYFGPTNVAFWRIAINTDAGDPHDAVALAEGVNPSIIPSASRQASFHADLGRSLARVGSDGAAVRQLRAAHRIAPQRIAADPLVGETVRGLVNSAHRRAVDADLRLLAERMRVPA